MFNNPRNRVAEITRHLKILDAPWPGQSALVLYHQQSPVAPLLRDPYLGRKRLGPDRPEFALAPSPGSGDIVRKGKTQALRQSNNRSRKRSTGAAGSPRTQQLNRTVLAGEIAFHSCRRFDNGVLYSR